MKSMKSKPRLLQASIAGRLSCMRTATQAVSSEVLLDSDSLFQTLVNRLNFAKAAEEWSRCVSNLSSWEGEHLLVDNPAPQRVAQHKQVVERLMLFGQLCAFIASYPEYDDVETAEMVHATQLVLKDKLRMWHGPRMSDEAADRILKEVFPEP